MRIDLTLIVIALIVLKVLGYINLSWWIILLPFILVLSLFSFILILLLLAIVLSLLLGQPIKITTKKKD